MGRALCFRTPVITVALATAVLGNQAMRFYTSQPSALSPVRLVATLLVLAHGAVLSRTVAYGRAFHALAFLHQFVSVALGFLSHA